MKLRSVQCVIDLLAILAFGHDTYKACGVEEKRLQSPTILLAYSILYRLGKPKILDIP